MSHISRIAADRLFRWILIGSFIAYSLPMQSAEADGFVDSLIDKMTVEEKIGQLNLLTSDWDTTGPSIRTNYVDGIKSGRVGAVFNAYTAEFTRELQELAVNETRLGIPLLFGYDVIHGHRTIFPISLGEAASWDLPAIENAARVAAREASAEGVHWTFAPMLDVSRDPRWGRVSEGAGEDPFLTTVVSEARIRGFQGDDLKRPDTLLACAKHFAAYGAAQAGRDYHSTDMSLNELHNTFLPPFKAALDAGVGSMMSSFNDLNGVPASANRYLLNDILRKQWGFTGFVVSDYTSINELVPHGFAVDEADAASLALSAGIDMDMQGSVYDSHIKAALEQGELSMEVLDRAVKRVLTAKYNLGLFENPFRYSDVDRQKSEIYSDNNVAAAIDMAARSFVLLKNKNNTLPLANKKTKIALVGPLADSKADMIGSWSAAGDRNEKPVTLLEALKAKAGLKAKISYAKGASYEFNFSDDSMIKKAVAVAKKSDVIVAAVGERWDMTGEAASRTSLTLPGNQRALLAALKKLDKPLVVIVFSGRPNALEFEHQISDAMLHVWYPGTFGAHAIATTLFGGNNPSGKLPMTFPRNVGQVPIFYSMKNTGRPYEPDGPEQKYRSRYLNTPNTPLFPFGFGLSYTQFEYGVPRVDRSKVTENGKLTVTTRVTNVGLSDGHEIAQLYIRDDVGSITRPLKELKAFEKVDIPKGEFRDVSFALTAYDFSFLNQSLKRVVEKGKFTIFIGPNSRDTQSLSVTADHSFSM